MTDEPHIHAAVLRLRQGDITGLAVLVETYQTRALRAAYLMTQDRHAAEDIVQTAFVRVYERIDQFDTSRPFAPWFLRGVVYDALAVARKQARHISLEATPDGDAAALIDSLRDGTPTPEFVAEADELRQAVRVALNALTPEQRAAVVLRYYLGLSEAEMSAELDTPAGTVKWRLHAARKHLRALLYPFRPKPALEE